MMMLNRGFLGLLTLQCFVIISCATAFVVPTGTASCEKPNPFQHKITKTTTNIVQLWGKSPNDDGNEHPLATTRTTVEQLAPPSTTEETVSPEEEANSSSSSNDDKERKKALFVVPKPVTKALLALGQVYNFATICVGTFFTCGIVLNIFGFGYAFTPDGGVRVDTIEEFRLENQYRKESKMLHSEHKPPSSLPE